MNFTDVPLQDGPHGTPRRGLRALISRGFFLILVGLIILAASSQTPGFAQEGEPPHEPPVPTPQGQGRKAHPPRRGADLVAAAQAEGPMKAIVQLNVQFIPEGQLINPRVETVATSDAVHAQRAAVADVKRALISQMVGHNVVVTATWEGLPAIAVTADAPGLQALLHSPLVVAVYEDVPEPPLMGYNLPYLNVSSPGGAWDQGLDGSGQTVAVLDVGTFANHEFLTGKVVDEACFSTNHPSSDPLNDAHSLCPGSASSDTGSGAADPYARCVTLAGPGQCEHGTHVAGIVAGNWGFYDASTLIQPIDMGGVARGASLIPIQVFTYFSDCDGTTGGSQPCVATYSSDQISAINYVYNTLASVGPGAGPYDIAAINLSLGGGYYTGTDCDTTDQTRQNALANLRAVGIAPVIAAGNGGYTDGIAIPGCLSAAVAVGATETNFLSGPDSLFITPNWPTDAWCQTHTSETCYGSGTEKIASFSSIGPALELLAPGYFIESSRLGANSGVIDAYGLLQGTSMATPIVSGAWAVLKQQSPVASVERILATLQSTGVGIADSPYFGNSIGWPVSNTLYRSGAPGTVYQRVDVGAAALALGRDFGDAPASYDTLSADNGARHIRVPEYYLGASADSEADGTPGVDDGEDDGVSFPTMLAGTAVNVDVIASVAQAPDFAPDDGYLGRLYAWIDFNQDGDFADAGEQVVNGLVMTGPYPQAIPITIPSDAVGGATWARFRYSTQTGLSYNGQAYNGEVEDYPITIITEPEIEVAGPGPVAISVGGSYDLGPTVIGTPVTRTITVSNTGTLPLSLFTDPPTVTGDFSVTNFGTTTVPADGSTSFDLTCDATSAGSPVSGTVSFSNNDSNENPFNFTVTCTVLAPPVAPTGLSATGVSGVEIDLSWTDNSSDETNFHVERSPSGQDNWEEIGTVGADVATYSDTDLTCLSAYDYRVRAYRTGVINLYSDYSNVATGQTTNQCPPTLLSPLDGTLSNYNLPTFTWDTLAWAAMYRIQVDNDPAFGSPAVDAVVDDTTYTALAPLPDGVYFWRVSGLDAGSHPGEWSAPWTLMLDPLRLAAPGLTRPKDHTYTKDTTPTFRWRKVSGAVLYEVRVSNDYNLGATLADVQTTSRYYTLPAASELDYGVYYWQVRAQDVHGNWSDWSYINTVTITILNSPKNAKHLTDTTPLLRWKSAAYGALYEVEVDEIGGDFSDPAFSYNGPARYIASSELPGGDYQWRARADTGSGWSVWTPIWTFTITPPTTTRPPLVMPANYAILDTTTPDFEWSAVPGGVTYQIQISAKSNFRTPVQDVTLDPGVLTYTADPLADGGRYFWRVRAVNSEGVAGAWSRKWRFTLNQLVRPVLLAPEPGTHTTNTAPDLSWSPVIDAVSYEIQLDTDKKFGTPQILTTADTFITPSPLPDGKYFWRVRAVNAAGVTGVWSGKWNVTVDTTGPDLPVLRGPGDRAGTRDTTPTLHWKRTKTAKQYRLQVAEDADFTSIEIDVTIGGRYYTIPAADALDYGIHHWRVQAADALGNWGEWSTPFQFALTLMIRPKDGTATTGVRPTFSWAAAAGAVAYHFELADNPDFNAPLTGEHTGLNRSYVPPLPLTPGVYYWHVQADTGAGYGDWMPTWAITITPAKPGRPGLSSPPNRAILGDNTPSFDWLAATNGDTYQIQIDNNRDFSSPEQDVTVGVGLLSYVADALPDGRYYWHVRAFNTDSAPGRWSAKHQVIIDTTPPPVPDLLAPLDEAASTNRKLKLSWTKVNGATAYELHLDPNPAFPLPVISTGKHRAYTPPTPLSRATYWWQVRAIDKAGNASAWSAPRKFEIVAGVTAPTAEPLTPLLPEPTLTPTVEPTTEPTQSPEPTLTPTVGPTTEPTQTEPTIAPTMEPTQSPEPTLEPTTEPTQTPEPTLEPTLTPTQTPVPTLTPTQTPEPTLEPTLLPTQTPVPTLTPTQTPEPTLEPTLAPTQTPVPTLAPTTEPP